MHGSKFATGRSAALAKLGASAVSALAGTVSGSGSLQSRCNAVWALTRIDGADARSAVRTALGDTKPSVRQAAARSAGLHRDRKALEPLMAIVTSDEPPVRREAATALGASARLRRWGPCSTG